MNKDCRPDQLYTDKSGLMNKHIVKHIVNADHMISVMKSA